MILTKKFAKLTLFSTVGILMSIFPLVSQAAPSSISTIGFVFTGESNSGGLGRNSDATLSELAPRSAVQIMNLTSGLFQFEDLDIGTNNLREHYALDIYFDNSHGFELELANAVEANAFPDNPQVYVVKTGQGGSQVGQWNVGGGYWTSFLQRTAAAKAQLPGSTQWVVWMSLGINDFLASVPDATWKAMMVAHINKIKADLPGAIIVLTGFQSMTGGAAGAYISTIEELAAEEANVYAIDSTGADLRDGNHWSYLGLKTVTDRMIDVTKNALGLIYPGAPTSLNATPNGGQVSLSWTAPVSDGGASINDYLIEYKKSSDSVWVTFAHSVSTATSMTVTGLEDVTNYDFRVSGVNSNGSGNLASVSATTTDGTAPAISSVNSSPTSTTSSITWTTDEASSSIVDYGLDISYGNSTTEFDISPRVTSHTISLSGLASCTIYHYRVSSKDSALNTGMSGDNTFRTLGCTRSSSTPSAGGGSSVKIPVTLALNSNRNLETINKSPAVISPLSSFRFIRDLQKGMTGNDVHELQKFLVSQNIGIAAIKLANNGLTHYFGPLTQSALAEFQKAKNIFPAIGYFGPITRAFVNK